MTSSRYKRSTNARLKEGERLHEKLSVSPNASRRTHVFKTKPKTKTSKPSPEAQYAVLKMLSMYYKWELTTDEKGNVVVVTTIRRPEKSAER